MRKNPISCVVNVLACRANATAVNIKPDSVAHLMFDAFVLGQSLSCGESRPRTGTQITLKHQHLTIMHMLLAVQTGLEIEKLTSQLLPFIREISQKNQTKPGYYCEVRGGHL